MISIVKLCDLIVNRYLNCYKTYLDLIKDNNSSADIRYNLIHRMYIYYEILEVIADSING